MGDRPRGGGGHAAEAAGDAVESPGDRGGRAAEAVGAAIESPRDGGGDLHDGRPFAGMRFLMIPSPGQERLEKRIAALGGQVLGPLDYKSCTHVCLDSDFMEDLQDALRREGKVPVSHDWVIEHFNRSNLVLDDGEQAAFQGSANGDTDADGMCDLARSVRREHCCMDGDEDEEMIHRRHHALFLCKLDWSPRISLHDYAAGMQNRLQVTVAVPGSRDGQISVSTEPDVKFIVMKAHRLLRCLHEAGLSLAGNFSSKNFLIGDVLFSKDIVLGHLPRGALKKCNDPADEELDLVRFDEMIRRELFVESIVPHDLNVWLSLIAEKGFQELLQDHISMMEVYHSVFTFTSLCNDFEEMEHDDPDKHSAIISELSEYSDWKRRVNAREGNSYLQETLQYIDPATNKMECYEEDLRGLVRLVLNYFERAETWGTFALIVEQNFPNLLSDLQEKMFKAGYYVPRLV